ncbi:MAG: hypothetical protein JRN59_03340 [Nitrososphaerota archaeon]|nr:hypothetical protein [Nitrososphaerota archaeon]
MAALERAYWWRYVAVTSPGARTGISASVATHLWVESEPPRRAGYVALVPASAHPPSPADVLLAEPNSENATVGSSYPDPPPSTAALNPTKYWR